MINQYLLGTLRWLKRKGPTQNNIDKNQTKRHFDTKSFGRQNEEPRKAYFEPHSPASQLLFHKLKMKWRIYIINLINVSQNLMY
jgi:hypothetical protein